MLNKTLQKKINSRITEAELNINTKIDIFVQQVNSLINKQELLLKAINEDRLVITKILEHMEKLENDNRNTSNKLENDNRNTSNRSNTTKSSSKRKTR